MMTVIDVQEWLLGATAGIRGSCTTSVQTSHFFSTFVVNVRVDKFFGAHGTRWQGNTHQNECSNPKKGAAMKSDLL